MMRKILLIIIIYLSISICCIAQTNENKYFLWDVTLSMKGQGSTPAGNQTLNIWEPVKKSLLEAIQQINDPSTRIFIIPFQDEVLDIWQAQAYREGKIELLNRIRNFDTERPTRTNICGAWDEVFELIDFTKQNTVILMTDGFQNYPGLPEDCLISQIERWCSLADSCDGYAFYVRLTEEASNPELDNAIANCPKIDTIDGTDFNRINIEPFHRNYFVNIQESHLSCDVSFQSTPDKFDMSGLSLDLDLQSNPYFALQNDMIDISGNKSKIHFRIEEPLATIQNVLPEEYSLTLDLSKSENQNNRVTLQRPQINITFKNRKEKVLNIYVKEE
jgi:hypothetical protein